VNSKDSAASGWKVVISGRVIFVRIIAIAVVVFGDSAF